MYRERIRPEWVPSGYKEVEQPFAATKLNITGITTPMQHPLNKKLKAIGKILGKRYLVAALFMLTGLLPASAQTWKLSSETEGIKVYMAAIPNQKIKAIKVECDLQTTLSQLVMVLLDVKACNDWVYSTKSCTLLKQVSASELYYYSEVNIPWPAQNRDFVAHLTITQNSETKVVTVDGPAVPGMVPVKKGVVRIDHSTGKWALTPLPQNKVHVVYTLQVDPGGAIPAWLVNLVAGEGPTQSFKKLRLQLQKPAYRDASLPFIKD